MSWFDSIVVQPIFNILMAIYAIMPGNDFGLSVIVLAVIVRLAMWPLIKKQLHHT
jgi:membrane protein insertase Oxa1/YidC/SpoIIIJ